MKHLNLILLTLFLTASAAQAQFATVWTSTSGSMEQDIMGESVTDSEGNTYFVSSITSTYTFDNNTEVKSKGGYDMMVAKIDAEGKLQWAKSYGSSADEMGRSIALDKDGNIFFAGSLSGMVDFGNGIMSNSSGKMDAFVAKMNATGEIEWAMTAGGSADDEWIDIETDGEGNVYLAGYVESNDAFFDGKPLIVFGGRDMFIVKVSNDGTVQWSQTPGTTDNEEINDISVNSQGEVLVNASLESTLVIGNDTIDTSLGLGVNIKYDAKGEVLWTDQMKEKSNSFEGAVDIDADGNIYTAGMFEGESTFGTETFTSKGESDIFIVKQNAEGAFVWAVQAGGDGRDASTDIEVLADGSIVVGGYFESTSTFGKQTVTSAGKKDNFVTKLQADGSFYGVVRSGGEGDDMVNSISSTTSGEIIASGTFEGTSNFKKGSATSNGESDHYTWKIRDEGVSVNKAIQEKSLSVFPNPVEGAITVSGLTSGSVMVLRDLTGQMISSYQVTTQNATIDVAPLNPGIYFIETIKPNNSVEIQQFIKN